MKPDSPLYTWIDVFKRIGGLTGKPFFWDDKMAESITKAGFINLTGRVIKVPIGTWPKDKTLKQWGAWNRQFLLQGLEGFSIRGLTEMLGVGFYSAQCNSEIWNLTSDDIVEVRGCTAISGKHAQGTNRPSDPCIPQCVSSPWLSLNSSSSVYCINRGCNAEPSFMARNQNLERQGPKVSHYYQNTRGRRSRQ